MLSWQGGNNEKGMERFDLQREDPATGLTFLCPSLYVEEGALKFNGEIHTSVCEISQEKFSVLQK